MTSPINEQLQGVGMGEQNIPVRDPADWLLGRDLSSTEMGLSQVIYLASDFLNRSVDEYDKVIAGEQEVKTALAMTFFMGAAGATNLITFGEPGSGKSRSEEYAHRIIGGMEDGMVAKVPHREDLSPSDLLGKSGKLVRTSVIDGKEQVETLSSETIGIIHPGISVIRFDEINRTSPIALNAAFELLQNGYITVEHQGVEEKVSGFDAVIMAMNHYGTRFTHSFDPAMVGRFAYGVEHGLYEPGKLSAGGEANWDRPGRYSGEPSIEPVITLDNLRYLREFIPHQALNDREKTLGKLATRVMRDSFKDEHGLALADPRLAAQFARGARAMSMIRGKEKVDQIDLRDVARLMITAKLGAIGSNSLIEGGDSLEKQVDNILGKIDEEWEANPEPTISQSQPQSARRSLRDRLRS